MIRRTLRHLRTVFNSMSFFPTPDKNLIINQLIEEIDFLVDDLRNGLGYEQDDILDALAVYLEIAESLDNPANIAELV